MKRYQFITLSILLILLIGVILIDHVEASPLLGSGAPTVVSYQGVVKDGGTPYTGTGYFKFALVNAAGTTSYWSNDGSSTGGSEPDTYITLPVVNGLFQALLGDTNITNMISLQASAFEGTDRYLRIWFSSGEITFALLSPDQRIAAVPYALQAEEAKYAENAEYAVEADTLDGLDSTDLYTRAEVDGLLAAYETRIADLETKLASVSVSGDDLYFTGVNVHVRSGSGSTNGAVNGRGNLIVGYNENSGATRTGSHNLVVGPYHSYSSYGGLIAGYSNTVSGTYSTVSSGYGNTASGNYSSVSGGYANTASEYYSSVSGGANNTASGYRSSVNGGRYNVASGNSSSVLGGGGELPINGNEAWAHYTVVVGGDYNVAGDNGGTNREAGQSSVVLGGYNNQIVGDFASISGGRDNTASGIYSSVSGGVDNEAGGESSTIGGGANGTVTGGADWLAGTLFEEN